VTRDADAKIQPASGAAPSGDLFDRQRFFSEMHSRCAGGQRHIQAIVDEDLHASRARLRNGKTRKLGEPARLKVLLTNLNPAGARSNRVSNGITKEG
jgi:hypothetical protein